MAYDITGMANHVKGEAQVILQDVILGGRSFELLTVQQDIKEMYMLKCQMIHQILN